MNLAAEIALAGGLPPPQVHVVDSPLANAAVTGGSPDDAAVVVSRGLLDGLGREETQGVVAHLVGRVGNGDLAIARTIASLYYTLGLCSAVLTAPTDRRARRRRDPSAPALPAQLGRPAPRAAKDAASALLEAQGGSGGEAVEAGGCLSVLLLPLMAGAAGVRDEPAALHHVPGQPDPPAGVAGPVGAGRRHRGGAHPLPRRAGRRPRRPDPVRWRPPRHGVRGPPVRGRFPDVGGGRFLQ